MGNIFWWIYVQPLKNIILTMLLLPIFWTVLHYLLRKKPLLWRIINSVVFITSLSVILYLTLIHRGESEYDVILTPFHSFIEARIQPEIYRSMLMNVFLFEPLGLALSSLLSSKRHPVLLTILFSLIFSSAIEATQYYFNLGRCEVDDILMNTLGTAIGCIPVLVVRSGAAEKVVSLLKRMAVWMKNKK